MSVRLLGLHLRARRLPWVAFAVGLVALTAWLGTQWIMHRPFSAGPTARTGVCAFAPLIAAVLLGPTLAGADEDLERATPARWWRWRAVQVLTAAGVIAAALSLTGLVAPAEFGAYALIRNAVACVGLVAAGATVFGASLAWLPGLAYVSAVVVSGPHPIDTAARFWSWPTQPSSVAASWWTAAGLLCVGLIAYAGVGRGRSAPRRDG